MEASFELGGVRWWPAEGRTRDSLAPLLARALAAHAGGSAPAKRGRRKALHRLDLLGAGAPDHLLKVNHYPRARRRSKARHELVVAEALAARGLPTPVPLAAGELRRGGRLEACFLLVAILPGVVDLRRRLAGEGDTSPAARRALAAAFGRLARRLHEAGLHQDDFQPNNFLVRDAPGGPELWVIDFERARLGRRVPDRLRRRALAKLDRELGREPASLRLRFLRAYCEGDPLAARDWLRAVAGEAPALARRDAAHLLRNAARPGRRFAGARVPGFSGLALPGLDAGRLAAAAARGAPEPGAVSAAADAAEWTLTLARPGVRHARRALARALVLAARGLAPRPLAVLCGGDRSLLILERAERSLRGCEVRANASVEAAGRVLDRRLDAYGQRRRRLEPSDRALVPAGPGRVRAVLLSVEAFALRPRFAGRGGSAARSR